MPSGALTSVTCAPCEFLNMIKSSCQFFALSPCSWWPWPEVNRWVALIINNRSGMSLLQRRWYFGKVPYSDKPDGAECSNRSSFLLQLLRLRRPQHLRDGSEKWVMVMKKMRMIDEAPDIYSIQIRLQDQVGYDDMVIFADVMAMVIWWASQTVRWWHLQLKALCLPVNSVDFQAQSSQPWAIFRFREWQR